jgi:Lipase (class 3)
MRDDSAIGPGLLNPVYPDLGRHMIQTTAVPDDITRFVLGVCSAYAYGDASTVAMIMDRLGLTRNRCRMISEYVDALFLTSVAYLIQSHDGRVAILCYRGTPPTSLITWLTDLQVEPVKVPVAATGTGHVHGGFYRNVRSTRFKIVQLLQYALAGESVLGPAASRVADGPERGLEVLYVTGHSLGGASAALLPALLAFDPTRYGGIDPGISRDILKRLRAVYTYGAPMSGDPAFADACNADPFLRQNVVRYVYANDVVPRLPPKASGDFEHFGREYRYTPPGDGGEWRQSPPRKQLSNVFQLATAPLAVVAKTLAVTRHLRFRASLNDHFPQYYIDALARKQRLRSEFGE